MAFERLRRRLADMISPPMTRRFDAAGGGNRWSGRPHMGGMNTETLAAHTTVRSRARYAAANNGWAANGVGAWTTGLVGPGFVATSQHPDPAVRKQVDKAFKRWCAAADIEGRTDFPGLCASAVRGMVIDGESLLHVVETHAGPRLRLLPAEQLDSSKTGDLTDGGYDAGGIRFDAMGRRHGYWILPVLPSSAWETWTQPLLVDADDLVHLMQPIGAGQCRGVSWLAPCLLTVADLDQLLDALLVGAKVAAMHAGFLIDQNGTGQSPYGDGDLKGSVLESGLEPGTMKFLPAGYDVKFSTPQQAQQSIEFAQLTLRQIAAGLGTPEFLLSGDMRGANYSSMRSALVSFRQRIEQIQFSTLVPQLLTPVFRRVITSAVLRGEIEALDFESNPDDWLSVEWIMPAQPWVDPAKDAQATVTLIENKLMSRRQAVAERGYSVDELDAEIAADREREESLGPNPKPAPAKPDNPKKEPAADDGN